MITKTTFSHFVTFPNFGIRLKLQPQQIEPNPLKSATSSKQTVFSIPLGLVIVL